MNAPRLVFLVRRIGPYHDARFEAVGRRCDLTVIETRPGSAEYPWATAPAARHYRREAFRGAAVPEAGLSGAALAHEVGRVLGASAPAAVACSGWADREYHAVLRWCQPRGVPVVVMSDSTYADEPRRWWREAMKGFLVRNFSAAVVAGERSRSYLGQLGFPAAAVCAPLDVVDNAYFAAGADAARAAAPAGVPRRFLCVARFIPKKNLEGLLTAYAAYVAQAGAGAWALMLSGSGELEFALRRRVDELGLTARVTFPGFLQYPDLPAAYARAGALVLPSWSDQWGLVVNEAMAAGLPVLVSRACGCAPDLVREGENGWTFDPHHPAELATGLARVAALDAARWAAFGRCSREIIARYSPEAFAQALEQAVAAARVPARGGSPLSRAVIDLMAFRQSLHAP